MQVHLINKMGGVQDDGLRHSGHTSMLEANHYPVPAVPMGYHGSAGPLMPMGGGGGGGHTMQYAMMPVSAPPSHQAVPWSAAYPQYYSY